MKSRSAVVLMLAALLVVAACDRRTDASAPVASTPEVTPAMDGWIALFDGSSAAAFRG